MQLGSGRPGAQAGESPVGKLIFDETKTIWTYVICLGHIMCRTWFATKSFCKTINTSIKDASHNLWTTKNNSNQSLNEIITLENWTPPCHVCLIEQPVVAAVVTDAVMAWVIDERNWHVFHLCLLFSPESPTRRNESKSKWVTESAANSRHCVTPVASTSGPQKQMEFKHSWDDFLSNQLIVFHMLQSIALQCITISWYSFQRFLQTAHMAQRCFTYQLMFTKQ